MGVHGYVSRGVHKVMKYLQRAVGSSHTSSRTPLRERLVLCMSLSVSLIASWSCDESATGDAPSTSEMSELTPLINSNTNWLLSCSEDTDCDQGEACSCGSCVIPCEEMRGCSIDPRDIGSPSVSCAIADPVYERDSCGDDYRGPMTAICLPQCESADDCPRDLVCYDRQCKRPRREGCVEARRCLEAGDGDPETCRALCSPEQMSVMNQSGEMSRLPSPEMLRACVDRCIETRDDAPEECRRRCMDCEERCRFLEFSPMECRSQCGSR